MLIEIKEISPSDTPGLAGLLEVADKDPHLHGFVLLQRRDRKRVVVFVDGSAVGFLSPRLEGDHWRIGATYFYPNFRRAAFGYSLAVEAYKSFFHGLRVFEVVDKGNNRAKKFLSDCGLAFYRLMPDGVELWSNDLTVRNIGEYRVSEPLKLNHEILNSALKIVGSWDFTLTKQKLLEPAYAGWTQSRADAAELGYKRYLAVTKALNGYQPVPNGDIDRFWHEHILDTRRYLNDCEQLFGYFLHHYPYFGMRGEDDNRSWKAASQFSNDVWVEAFGEALYGSQGSQPQVSESQKSAASSATTQRKESDMPVHISITINVNGAGVTTSVGAGADLMAEEAMKCPQACPNPGLPMAIDSEAMKCPQACPNPALPSASDILSEAMKCPQACPNPGVSDAAGKCPQSCPSPGAES